MFTASLAWAALNCPLTGEVGENGADVEGVRAGLAERFYALEVRDETRPAVDLWEGAGEDSLKGLFLQTLKGKYLAAQTEEERETVIRAVRFGLAALERRDMG